jgi:thymidylate synthase (FAD)
MKIIEQSVSLEFPLPLGPLQILEKIGRLAHRSEDAITPDSAGTFLRRVVHDLKHESILEHIQICFRWITDRGVTHELVRHRQLTPRCGTWRSRP